MSNLYKRLGIIQIFRENYFGWSRLPNLVEVYVYLLSNVSEIIIKNNIKHLINDYTYLPEIVSNIPVNENNNRFFWLNEEDSKDQLIIKVPYVWMINEITKTIENEKELIKLINKIEDENSIQ